MPVRDGLPFLDNAIDSIVSQTLTDFVLVLVDDGSTDGTSELLDSWAKRDRRIRIIHQEPSGHYAALNVGLECCATDLVARMDADDIAMPDRFKQQVAFLNANPDVVAVGGQVIAIDADGDHLFSVPMPIKSDVIQRGLLSGQNGLTHPAVMYQRRVVIAAGGYEDESPSEDFGLWLRMLPLGKFANLDSVVLKYRLHANVSRISRHAVQRNHTLRLLEKAHAALGTPVPELPPSYPPHGVADIHHHWAMSAAAQGHWSAARKHVLKSIELNPMNAHAYWTFAKTCLRFRGFH